VKTSEDNGQSSSYQSPLPSSREARPLSREATGHWPLSDIPYAIELPAVSAHRTWYTDNLRKNSLSNIIEKEKQLSMLFS